MFGIFEYTDGLEVIGYCDTEDEAKNVCAIHNSYEVEVSYWQYEEIPKLYVNDVPDLPYTKRWDVHAKLVDRHWMLKGSCMPTSNAIVYAGTRKMRVFGNDAYIVIGAETVDEYKAILSEMLKQAEEIIPKLKPGEEYQNIDMSRRVKGLEY